MIDLLSGVFCCYIITLVICKSTLFAPVRYWVIQRTPYLYSPLSVLFNRYFFGPTIVHPIECRLCTGFWVSLIYCIVMADSHFFIIYGLSYLLATQERN